MNSLGFRYRNTRKKGVLLRSDLKKRRKFARDTLNAYPGGTDSLWKEGISFYFDGTGFVHKNNPLGMAMAPKGKAWRLPKEGLAYGCTGKGRKEGVHQVRFFVGISYGRGVVMCEQYEGRISGKKMEQFAKDHFEDTFDRCALSTVAGGRRVLQDGCPSQNDKRVLRAMQAMDAETFAIPARSPDLNPIENLFHLVGKRLEEQVLRDQIFFENDKTFARRVKKTIENFPADVIDKIIDSMPGRLRLVLKARGGRIKY